MSERKVSAYQQTLTQMSRRDKTRRRMDDALLTSIRNVQKREWKFRSVESDIARRSETSTAAARPGTPVGGIHSSSSSDEDFVPKASKRLRKSKKRYYESNDPQLSPNLLSLAPGDQLKGNDIDLGIGLPDNRKSLFGKIHTAHTWWMVWSMYFPNGSTSTWTSQSW